MLGIKLSQNICDWLPLPKRWVMGCSGCIYLKSNSAACTFIAFTHHACRQYRITQYCHEPKENWYDPDRQNRWICTQLTKLQVFLQWGLFPICLGGGGVVFWTLKAPIRQMHARTNQKHMEVRSLLEPAAEALPDSKSKPALATLITAVVGILVEYSQRVLFGFLLLFFLCNSDAGQVLIKVNCFQGSYIIATFKLKDSSKLTEIWET